jgi:hypothetical protein
VNKTIVMVIMLLALVVCACGAGGTSEGDNQPTSQSPTPSVLAQACSTYESFARYAREDMAHFTRTTEEIVMQLTEYQDSFDTYAARLSGSESDTVQALADAIGHLKNAMASFGPFDDVTTGNLRNVIQRAEALLAICPQ